MTTKEQIELESAIEELERTENMTDEELEQEAIETYGSRAEELDYILDRLTELSKRDFYRFQLALRYKRKSLKVRSQISAGAQDMMPELLEIKELCDDFVAKTEQWIGRVKENEQDKKSDMESD